MKTTDDLSPMPAETNLDRAFIALANYLRERGWVQMLSVTNDMGQWIDPITKRTHDIDYAFTVDLCRHTPVGSLV